MCVLLQSLSKFFIWIISSTNDLQPLTFEYKAVTKPLYGEQLMTVKQITQDTGCKTHGPLLQIDIPLPQ